MNAQTGQPTYVVVGREVAALFRLALNPEEPLQAEYVKYRKHEKRVQLETKHTTQFLKEGALDEFLASNRKEDRDRLNRLIFEKTRCIEEQIGQLEKLNGGQVEWKQFGPRSFAEVLPPKQVNLEKIMMRLVKQFGYPVLAEELRLAHGRAQLLAFLRSKT